MRGWMRLCKLRQSLGCLCGVPVRPTQLTRSFAGYLDTLFKITHVGTFNTSLQALALIFQVSQSQSQSQSSAAQASATGTSTGLTADITNRFYRTLYDSLLDPRVLSSSKQAMYLNLLFGALKADGEIKRVMAFVKRLCQLFGMAGVPFLSGALFLLGEVGWALSSGAERARRGAGRLFADLRSSSIALRGSSAC
jgi:ribosome biogenesis protein MAK21